MEITFYTRDQCPLCQDAKLVLLELKKEYPALTIDERNIEEKDEWTEKYGLMIPVVEINGELIQYGIIDPFTIEERFKKGIN